MNGYGNIQFLGEGEIGIDRRIAGRDTLILQSDLAHYFEAAGCEIFSQLFECNTLAESETVTERRARDDPGGCGVFPFLHTLWIAKGNRRDVEALHLGEYILHILARRRRIKRRRALLLHPTERRFLVFRIRRRKLRGVWTHRRHSAGKVPVYGVDVNIEDRRNLALGVLRERNRRAE